MAGKKKLACQANRPPSAGPALERSYGAKGLDPGAVDAMSLRVFNRKPDALTHEEAAGLIRELSNLKRRVA